ncbi:MAG: hypothetical protein ACXV8Q_08830 [Methylobacter sp.]
MLIKFENKRSPQGLHTSSNAKSHLSFAPIFILAALTSMTIGTANAQTDAQRIADLERNLKSALSVIDKLSSKMEQLEKSNKTVAESKSTDTVTPVSKEGKPDITAAKPTDGDLTKTVTEQNSRIETMQRQVTQLSSAASNRIIPFDWLHGFADVGGGYGSSGHPAGFGVGSLDLYMTPKLGGKVRSLVELVFEYDRVGGLGTDLERTQIGYAFNDQATVWLGRFHTPYGYWQTAYHHGQQIQPSLLRPRFIDFEDKGGILPAHTTGVWGTGGLQFEGGKFTYDVYAGNTPRIVPNNSLGNGNLGNLDPNVAGFGNHSLTAGAKFGYNFTSGKLDGLNVGIHGLRSQVQVFNNFDTNPTGPSNGQVELNMAGGYLYYNNYDWEIISEAYGFMNHEQQPNAAYRTSWAGFVHVGHAFDRWMPYGRLERADTNQNDLYFKSMALGYAYSREALGLRFDVNTQSALKLELNYTQPQANMNSLVNFWESRLQYAIRF